MRVIAFTLLFCLIAYSMAQIDPESKMPWVLDMDKAPENPSNPYFVSSLIYCIYHHFLIYLIILNQII